MLRARSPLRVASRSLMALGRIAAGLGTCAASMAAQMSNASAMHVIVIMVKERDSGRALVGAEVCLAPCRYVAVTDSSGRAVIKTLRAPRFVVDGRRIGYAPARVQIEPAAGDTTTASLPLAEVPQELAKVSVPGEADDVVPRLAAFEHRRRTEAGGSFITRANLESWQTTHLTDALRRIPGVRIVDSLYTKFAASSRSPKPVILSRDPRSRGEIDLAPCVMRVGVDGFIKEPTFELDEFPVSEIHGVEIYAGPASIPPQFGGLRKDAYCGLVMIWTRAK